MILLTDQPVRTATTDEPSEVPATARYTLCRRLFAVGVGRTEGSVE